MATQGRHADLVERLRAIASRFDMTSTERYEQDSEAFYAATGYMAPGKDVPMAMGWQNETERRAAHEAWIASRNRSQQQAIQEAADALAALPPPANPLYEYCPSCRRLGPLLGLTAIRSEETGGRHCISCFGKTESRLLPLWTAPPPADPPAIVALGERLRTQDNQMTAHPIFVVEHRNDARRPWEFVTACLTDEGARAYMNANGHRHKGQLRMYVESAYRNTEIIELQAALKALKGGR